MIPPIDSAAARRIVFVDPRIQPSLLNRLPLIILPKDPTSNDEMVK